MAARSAAAHGEHIRCQPPYLRFLGCRLINGAVAASALTRADVTLHDHRGQVCSIQRAASAVRAVVRLRGSKTDQEGRGIILSLERSGSGWLCPVLAAIDLISLAISQGLPPSAPLTAWNASSSVKATTMIKHLRQAAVSCGLDPSRMGTHSLRSGGATAMMAAGIDLQAIKLFGRWKSDSVDRYTRLTAATTKTLSARMVDHAAGSQ